MKKIQDNFVDSCISDFPYNLSFMGKKWDTFSNFYEWCYKRAEELYRVMKPGGYVLIFGHPKTNHRMKSAFEDCGFQIVDEIDWVYLTGMPKNQDIGKLFDKKAGAERTEGVREWKGGQRASGILGKNLGTQTLIKYDTPVTDQAKQWDGWKTAGLKPAKEPITVFQKPLEGTYCDNIEKWNCGGMNIDACRVPYDGTEDKRTHGGDWSTKSAAKNVYSGGYEGKRLGVSQEGRFPPNIILDEFTAQILDEQTGVKNQVRHMSYKRSGGEFIDSIPSQPEKDWFSQEYGGGSRMFPIMKYCTKVSSKEKILKDETKNHHVTVKPIELIKWLIKLVTPKDGITIDITAGSCTHGAACEELNKNEDYNLRWCNIEIDQDEKGNSLGYVDFGKKRIAEIVAS